MNQPHQCPQCNAPLRPTTVGELEDKILLCEYCGCQIDVPDSSTVAEETVSTRSDGKGGTVRTVTKRTVTRSDVPSSVELALPGLKRIAETAAGPEGTIEFELKSDEPAEMMRELKGRIADILPPGSQIDIDELPFNDLVNTMLASPAADASSSRTITFSTSTSTESIEDMFASAPEPDPIGLSSAQKKQPAKVPFVAIVAGVAVLVILLIVFLS